MPLNGDSNYSLGDMFNNVKTNHCWRVINTLPISLFFLMCLNGLFVDCWIGFVVFSFQIKLHLLLLRLKKKC